MQIRTQNGIVRKEECKFAHKMVLCAKENTSSHITVCSSGSVSTRNLCRRESVQKSGSVSSRNLCRRECSEGAQMRCADSSKCFVKPRKIK